MDVVAIAGLAGLILVKEAGMPLPVPGDLLIILAGASLAGDPARAVGVLALIVVVGIVGASLQFFLLGTALRRPLLAGLARLGIGPARLEALSDRFREAGSRSVAVTRMTPGVRIAVIPAAAVASLPYAVFLPGVAVGNGVFVTAHFGAGYLLGDYARDFIRRASDPMVVIIAALAILAVIGLVVLHRRARLTSRTDTYECWADCACPACVAIVAISPSAEPLPG